MKTPTLAVFRATRRNLPFFKEELKALIGNASLSVKCVCCIVICTYLLTYYKPSVETLSVIPGHLLPPSFRIWTLFTHQFLELHFWEVVIDIITIGLCGKLIEPLWGTQEMLKFFAIVNISVVIFCVSYYLLLYAITFDPEILFHVKIHGLSGYIAAVSVTVRQIMPDHVLLRTPLGKITNRNVPMSVFVFSILLWTIGLLEGTFCTMFLGGILSSWTYLRFYQRHTNGSRGDTTEYFHFAGFFPNVMQPPISVISNSIHNCLRKFGLFRNRVKTLSTSGVVPSSIQINIGNQEKLDADRRRQKALKLLGERLGIPQIETNNSSATPLLLDQDDDGEERLTSISIPSSSGSREQSTGKMYQSSSATGSFSSPVIPTTIIPSSSSTSTLQ